MPDPTPDALAEEREVAAFEGFLLGLRVFYQVYSIDAPASEFERPWEVLRDVAKGDLSVANPGDLAAKHPGMAEFLSRRANLIVANDRVTARRVLDGLQRALGSGHLPEPLDG